MPPSKKYVKKWVAPIETSIELSFMPYLLKSLEKRMYTLKSYDFEEREYEPLLFITIHNLLSLHTL